MVNQIETNVWFQRKEEEKFLKKEGIAHEAWAPFAEGNNDVFNAPVLKEIGEKYGKSTGQVMLRWLIQRDVIVIPKSVKKERMKQNIDRDIHGQHKDQYVLKTEQLIPVLSIFSGCHLIKFLEASAEVFAAHES
jgi:diketogulonate reductase-like aldo/keto reductase